MWEIIYERMSATELWNLIFITNFIIFIRMLIDLRYPMLSTINQEKCLTAIDEWLYGKLMAICPDSWNQPWTPPSAGYMKLQKCFYFLVNLNLHSLIILVLIVISKSFDQIFFMFSTIMTCLILYFVYECYKLRTLRILRPRFMLRPIEQAMHDINEFNARNSRNRYCRG